MDLKFRSDIQALRGVAVLAVFIFHLHASALPSGFLGVDIFFVISGFLLASLYDVSTLTRTLDFFLRRARRILPAYYVVLTVTFVATSFLVLPHEFQTIAGEALASALLVPNISLWAENSYFDKATFRPLLHFWSLGVELQFYLLFPIIVLCARNYVRLTAAAGIASLATCFVMVNLSPKTAFFLLPFRLWEFLAGFYAAKLVTAGLQFRIERRWIGFVLLAAMIAVMLVPISEAQHPKWGAVTVTVLSALLLVMKIPEAAFSIWPGRALVTLGKYSYSIYLVHFPVIVLWYYKPFAGITIPSATMWDAGAIIALTALFSALLFHAIETPVRQIRPALRYLEMQAGVTVVALILFVVLPPLLRLRFTEAELQISDAWFDRAPYRCGKIARLIEPMRASCALTRGKADAPTFLLVGDSYADAIKGAMSLAAAEAGARLRLMKYNYTLGVGPVTVTNVTAEVVASGASTVILHSSINSQKVEDIANLVKVGETQGFRVILIDPVPTWPVHVPQALYIAQHGGPPMPVLTSKDYQIQNAEFLRAVEPIAAANFKRYRTVEYFCDPACKVASPSGKPFYFDSGHLTDTGAHRLEPVFRKFFE